MKRKRKTGSNLQKNRIKRPAAGKLVFFAVLLLLFAAFIWGGIKAGQYAEKLRSEPTAVGITEVMI